MIIAEIHEAKLFRRPKEDLELVVKKPSRAYTLSTLEENKEKFRFQAVSMTTGKREDLRFKLEGDGKIILDVVGVELREVGLILGAYN